MLCVSVCVCVCRKVSDKTYLSCNISLATSLPVVQESVGTYKLCPESKRGVGNKKETLNFQAAHNRYHLTSMSLD